MTFRKKLILLLLLSSNRCTGFFSGHIIFKICTYLYCYHKMLVKIDEKRKKDGYLFPRLKSSSSSYRASSPDQVWSIVSFWSTVRATTTVVNVYYFIDVLSLTSILLFLPTTKDSSSIFLVRSKEVKFPLSPFTAQGSIRYCPTPSRSDRRKWQRWRQWITRIGNWRKCCTNWTGNGITSWKESKNEGQAHGEF